MKVVSQETFDLVVLENIKDFNNTLEEAIEEAVKEFEAQGVQLTNIVKNLKLDEENESIVHSIIESLNQLRDGASALSEEDLISNLKIVQDECNLSLAHRILATKFNGYSILLKLIKELKDKAEILPFAINALASLTNTNPDILDEEGIEVMKDLFSLNQSGFGDTAIPESLAKWCLECCIKHESNRQNLMETRLPGLMISVLRLNRSDKKCVKAICKALRAFVLDDDIRTEFGKAHTHARMLVEEHHLIALCLDLTKDFLSDGDVMSELLSTVSRLCVRAEYCQEAVDNNALSVISSILLSFPDNSGLNRQGINLLKTISGNDKVKEEVMKMGAGQLIVGALVKHQGSPGVCEAGCGAVSMLSLRVPPHAKQLIHLGAAEAVVQAMKIHPNDKQIQKLGCMATRNLVSRVPENRMALIECGVEDVIRSSLVTFPNDLDLADVAKAALRDLDLKVQFQEQWKGTGAEIDR